MAFEEHKNLSVFNGYVVIFGDVRDCNGLYRVYLQLYCVDGGYRHCLHSRCLCFYLGLIHVIVTVAAEQTL